MEGQLQVGEKMKVARAFAGARYPGGYLGRYLGRYLGKEFSLCAHLTVGSLVNGF